ncbi:hypothetical protein SAMN02787144_103924 [Streptomyces atratus]|uniref:Uncharacterized protein n=1 Tax=Streptomyces atratus TaxID=1893 RepID=A0A1K2F9Q9_STRAR|nr:hypothetical protein SAMN02787144_103924 [Streptomyces atratus]
MPTCRSADDSEAGWDERREGLRRVLRKASEATGQSPRTLPCAGRGLGRCLPLGRTDGSHVQDGHPCASEPELAGQHQSDRAASGHHYVIVHGAHYDRGPERPFGRPDQTQQVPRCQGTGPARRDGKRAVRVLARLPHPPPAGVPAGPRSARSDGRAVSAASSASARSVTRARTRPAAKSSVGIPPQMRAVMGGGLRAGGGDQLLGQQLVESAHRLLSPGASRLVSSAIASGDGLK